MWRTIGEIGLLIAIGFVSGLFFQSRFHQCPEPKTYSSYEILVYVPTTPEEIKRLILHNKAQGSILIQLEEWEKQKEKEKAGTKKGK